MSKLPKAAWVALSAILILLIFALEPWRGLSSGAVENDGTIGNLEVAPDLIGAELSAAGNANESSAEREEVQVPGIGNAIFEVREEGGDVIVARIVVCREGKLLHSGSTNQEGRVEFTSDDLPCEVFISKSNSALHSQSLHLTSGLQVIVLPNGQLVFGTIINTNQEPVSGLKLRLRSDHPMYDVAKVPLAALSDLGLTANYHALRTTANELGEFQFAGLTDSWSGILTLPSSHEAQSVSAGNIMASQRGIRLSSPIQDLVVVVDKPQAVYGQLIDISTGVAVDQVRITSRSTTVGGEKPSFNSAMTDEEGRFILRLNPVEVGSIELHLGGISKQKPPIHQLGSGEVPGDGNLGVIHVSGLRDIPFLLRNRRDQAISDGIARAASLESKPTDNNGRGVLRWVPPEFSSLQFIANGYVPGEVKLAEPIPNPLTVYLDQANRLLVKIEPPGGVAADQFRAQLTSDSVMIAGPANTELDLKNYLSEWTFPRYQTSRLPYGHTLFARPNPDGFVSFHALKSDVAMTLEIFGITGDTVYHSETVSPLGAEENRELVVDLAQSGRHFHGRVTDLEGNAIIGATVQLGGQILAWTDGEGKFSCLVVEEKPRTLVLSANGSAARFIKDFQIPSDGSAVELKMEPALSVMINVVDEHETPIPDAEVSIIRGGFTTNTFSRGNARFEATGLSSEKVQIRTRVAGRDYFQDLLPSQSTARVVIPMQGDLTVQINSPTLQSDGEYRVVLVAKFADDVVVLSKSPTAAEGWKCHFPFVSPGVYRVSVNYDPSDVELADGMQAREVGAVGEVHIRAGANDPLSLEIN
jgi:hypothetical protein